jgi:Tfp pilus assembly protein PilE
VLSGSELLVVVLAVALLAVMAGSALAGIVTRLRRGRVRERTVTRWRRSPDRSPGD